MKLTKNPEFYAWTKHIGIKHYFIQDLVSDGVVTPVRVTMEDNVVDMLTKLLGWPTFSKHLTCVGMISDREERIDNKWHYTLPRQRKKTCNCAYKAAFFATIERALSLTT